MSERELKLTKFSQLGIENPEDANEQKLREALYLALEMLNAKETENHGLRKQLRIAEREFRLMANNTESGRDKDDQISEYGSEFALFKVRLLIEINFLKVINKIKNTDGEYVYKNLRLTDNQIAFLDQVYNNFSVKDALEIKEIEETTRHDIVALVQWLKGKSKGELSDGQIAHIHLGLTSEDANANAYQIMMRNMTQKVILPNLIGNVTDKLKELAIKYKDVTYASRTHGQLAEPTTVGKTLSNYIKPLIDLATDLAETQLEGKVSGAVGNYNDFKVLDSTINWQDELDKIVLAVGLKPQINSTQIIDYTGTKQYLDKIETICLKLQNLCLNKWLDISEGIIGQKRKTGERGSSAMPHKINPIDFEKAEGKFGQATALLRFISEKLLSPRGYRDLSNSTVIRNVSYALSLVQTGITSLAKGLNKIEFVEILMSTTLDNNWQILAAPYSNILRANGYIEAYDDLAEVMNDGTKFSEEKLLDWVNHYDLPQEILDKLLKIKPSNFNGLAVELTDQIIYYYDAKRQKISQLLEIA